MQDLQERPTADPATLPIDRRVVLLRELTRRTDPVLRPVPCTMSPSGFRYPAAEEVIHTAPGEERGLLEQMADLGLLERQFADKVRLCPDCSRFEINLREVCPSCGSLNVAVVDMIRHFHCGHVAPETAFTQGVHKVCPGCNRALRHLGVDYERPSSTGVCAGCDHPFREPRLSCLCHACLRVFPGERAVELRMYAYRLTERGTTAAESGRIEETERPSPFMEPALGIYTFRFLEERLDEEVSRARRYGHPCILLLVGVTGMEGYEEVHGRAAAAELFHGVARLVKEAARECDVVALKDGRTFALFLPDTCAEEGHVLAARFAREVEALVPAGASPRIALVQGFAEIADGVDTGRQLLEASVQQLEEASMAGEPCVRPRRNA